MISDTKITVMNRKQAIQYTSEHPMDDYTALISIATPNQEYNAWPAVNNAMNVLFVEFYDIVTSEEHVPVIPDTTAELIAATVQGWLNNGVKHILIHCDAGQSRSAGVARAIADAYQIPDNNITYTIPNVFPNPTVRDKIRNCLVRSEIQANLTPDKTSKFSDTIIKNLETISCHTAQLPCLCNANVFTATRAVAIRKACADADLAELKQLTSPLMWTVERDRVDIQTKMRCNLINRALNDCFREILTEVYQAICWIIIDHPEETELAGKLDSCLQAMAFENIDIIALKNRLLDLMNMELQTIETERANDTRNALWKTAKMLNTLISANE